jgi:hypothetical protein
MYFNFSKNLGIFDLVPYLNDLTILKSGNSSTKSLSEKNLLCKKA